MNTDINPYRSLSADITPTEFEIFCMETLRAYAKQEGLQQFRLNHNKKITADDGTYQIDIFAEYVALGTKNTLIVECKKHSRAIEREIVAALYTKVQSIGANKGLLISTTGFQTGATQFAQKHGITLWQICDNHIKHIKNSACKKNSEAEMFQFAVEHFLPKYFVMEWDCTYDYPYIQCYPTREMQQTAVDLCMPL